MSNNDEMNTVISEQEQNVADSADSNAQVVENMPADNKKKHADRKAERRERKQRWKAQKKQKREALKQEYMDAPFLTKLFKLYLAAPLKWIAVIAVIVGIIGYAVYALNPVGAFVEWYYYSEKDTPVEPEKIYEISPLDEEGAKVIEQLPTYAEDDTWTICVYMIGSNLESYDENDLSEVTKYFTSAEKAVNRQNRSAMYAELLSTFVDEIGEMGMSLPEYFYVPNNPEASRDYVYDEVIATDWDGCASTDITEMQMADLGDNVKIVIQTGGSTRWSNSLINPNKTQRFEISGGRINEVANLPLQDSCSVDTLAEFLAFCKQNYKSDHRILVFWDHGAGAFGFGSDEIFDSAFSVKDLSTALSRVYDESSENPAFELIGFDACLMANLEVCHELYGYGRYLAASEESEPGDGWDHTEWLNAFAQNGPTNGAKIAMGIADSYTDYYMTRNINVSDLIGETAATFSVIDINKAETAYEKYCDFAKAALIAATEDQSVLSTIGRAASRSVRYGGSSYNVFNFADIGTLMDQLVDDFPEEATDVKNAVKDAVLYCRQNSYLSDSQGLSVYMPVEVDTINGLCYYLKYINYIAEDDSIRALYYYKVGGCLNEELTEYALSIGCKDVPVLDLDSMKIISSLDVTIDDGNYSVKLPESTEKMIQKYQMTLALYDEENEIITYFGNDNYAFLDGEGNLATAFDGEWICINDQMLALEIVDEAPSSIQYRTKILCNGVESYMLLAYDRDTEEITVSGIRAIPSEEDESIANISDRNLKSIQVGDKIVPLYEATDLLSGKNFTLEGKKIRYGKNTTIEMKPIQNGSYFTYILTTDARGDEYYTAIIEFSYDNNGISDMHINEDFAIVQTD